MATESVSVTEAPTIVSGLSDGATYTFENSGAALIYIAESINVPDKGTNAKHKVRVDRPIGVIKKSGENIFAWVDADRGSLAYTEAS